MKLSTVDCASCGTTVKSIDPNIASVLCWECVAESMGTYEKDHRKYVAPKQEGYPRGWRFMKVFVHSDGTVYHKGVEQPQLKGTMDATQTQTKQKKSKAQKKKEAALIATEYAQVKKQLKAEKRKTEIKKLERLLKKLEKQL